MLLTLVPVLVLVVLILLLMLVLMLLLILAPLRLLRLFLCLTTADCRCAQVLATDTASLRSGLCLCAGPAGR